MMYQINKDCIRTHDKTWDKEGQPRDIELINIFNKHLKKLNSANNSFNVLDIGAQTGCFTLLAKFYKKSTWYAVEPIKKSYDLLLSNLKLNNIKNVHLLKNAMYDIDCVKKIKIPSNGHMGLPTLGNNPHHISEWYEENITCLKGDNLFFNKKIDIDIIKLDAEGAEIHILKGLKNTILKSKPIILLEVALGCLHGFHKNINDLLNIIEELNYHVTWYDRENWKLGGNIIIESNLN